jgi:hypothetical protein
MMTEIQSWPSAAKRMFPVGVSSDDGNMSAMSTSRPPYDSRSILTSDRLSFFQTNKFRPDAEKQNERYFGSVPPRPSWEPFDLDDFTLLGRCGIGVFHLDRNPSLLGLSPGADLLLKIRLGGVVEVETASGSVEYTWNPSGTSSTLVLTFAT